MYISITKMIKDELYFLNLLYPMPLTSMRMLQIDKSSCLKVNILGLNVISLNNKQFT